MMIVIFVIKKRRKEKQPLFSKTTDVAEFKQFAKKSVHLILENQLFDVKMSHPRRIINTIRQFPWGKEDIQFRIS